MSEYDRIGERILENGNRSRWYISVERGREKTYTNYECERRAKAAREAFGRWFSRAVKTRTQWTESEMNEYTLEQLRYLLDGMRDYVETASKELDRLEGKDRRDERIRQLRQVNGRTPEEAANYLAKAAQLEQRSDA